MEKFLKNEKKKVFWLACLAKGSRVLNENWEFSKGIITDGYKAARLVKGEDSLYKIICSVHKSNLGLPIYNICTYKANIIDNKKVVVVEEPEEDIKERNVSTLKIKTASSKILKTLKVKTTKNWDGIKFFGLDRKEVQKLLRSNSSGKSVEKNSNIPDKNSSNNVSVKDMTFQDHITWLGVQSYGEKVLGEFSRLYEKTYKNKTLLLRDGFTSIRGVVCEDKTVLVTCKILASGPTPLFVTQTDDHFVESENITIAVSSMLSQVKAITTTHWSGYEFFGLYRANVMKVLEKVTVNVDESSLREIKNVRSRNAGPTSHLKSKKSIEKRNEKIDDVVNYASFGDFKSKTF